MEFYSKIIKPNISNKAKILFSAFIASFCLFFVIPFLIIDKKGDLFNILPDLPKLFIDFFWTIQMAVDKTLIAYSPLTDLIFKSLQLNSFILNAFIYCFITLGLLVAFFRYCFKIGIFQIDKSTLLFLISFIFSYGFLFEFLWGQWNIVAFLIVFFAIYPVYSKSRLLSYLLFALAVHLKIYIFIFVLLYIRDFSNIRLFYKDIFYSILFAVIFFFIQGYDVLETYIYQIIVYSNKPAVWYANSSIYSFNENFNSIFNFNPGLITYCIIILILLIGIYVNSFRKKLNINGDLIFMLTIGAQLIPSVSIDYKMSLLSLSFPIYIYCNFKSSLVIDKAFLFFISFFYFSTLYSYKNYELILRNWFFDSKYIHLTMLLLLIVIYSILNLVLERRNKYI